MFWLENTIRWLSSNSIKKKPYRISTRGRYGFIEKFAKTKPDGYYKNHLDTKRLKAMPQYDKLCNNNVKRIQICGDNKKNRENNGNHWIFRDNDKIIAKTQHIF